MAEAILRAKKKILLSKIETIYADDPNPSVGANAVMVKNIDITPMEIEAQARDNIKPYFGNDEDVTAVAYAKVSFEVELTGSGTAGTVPPIGQLLRGVGMAETVLAAAVTGTATSGSLSKVVLAAGASATNNAYAGLTINFTAGANAGKSAVIKSYDAATKEATLTENMPVSIDNTTVYTIPAQVVYHRITDSQESITHYAYFDKVLHKMIGARGSASLSLSNKKVPTVKFSYTCIYVPVEDAPAPLASFSSRKKPLAVNSINTKSVKVLGYDKAVFSELSFDLANEVTFRSLPGAPERVEITDSKPTGSLTQEATTVATKDWWSAIRNSDVGALSLTHGIDVGNIIKIDCPRVQLGKPTYSDLDGIQMLQTSLKLLPDQGNDELTLCFL